MLAGHTIHVVAIWGPKSFSDAIYGRVSALLGGDEER